MCFKLNIMLQITLITPNEESCTAFTSDWPHSFQIILQLSTFKMTIKDQNPIFLASRDLTIKTISACLDIPVLLEHVLSVDVQIQNLIQKLLACQDTLVKMENVTNVNVLYVDLEILSVST